jgi:hypothetical protein
MKHKLLCHVYVSSVNSTDNKTELISGNGVSELIFIAKFFPEDV